MYSSTDLRTHARNSLYSVYWPAFGVCLVAVLISNGVDFVINRIYTTLNSHAISSLQVITFFGIFVLIQLAYFLFVENPLLVGQSEYFLNNHKGNSDFYDLFSSFNGSVYRNIVISLIWRILWNVIWLLLFVIPGIIKAFSYSMTPYILADNPDIGYKRALKLSIKMTNGYKMDIFKLILSFLGWYLLGIVCFGIGVLFVNPYFEAALAEMYCELRKNAVNKGICTPEELNLSEADFAAGDTQGLE